MTINSRAKGKSAEREVIGILKELIPNLKLERNLDQTRDGGYDIKGLSGWAPEVKRYANITHGDLDKFWKQTVQQARDSSLKPVLFMRSDRSPWVAVLRLTDVMDNILAEHDWSIAMTCQVTMAGFVHVYRSHDWD